MLNFPAIKTKLNTEHNLVPSQKVWLEWNYNVTAGITNIQVDNVDLYTYDNENAELKINESSSVYNAYSESLFPATAPFSFIRPGEHAVHNGQYVGGIVKGVFGSPSGISSYNHTSATRNYFCSKHDNYKYWAFLRKDQSSSTVNKSISAIYDRDIRVNKVVIKFETAHTVPTSYAVDLRVAGAWSEIYSSTTPLTTGGLILYRGASSWTTAKHTSPSIDSNIVTATGIRVRVNSVNVGYSPLEIIEVSPRLEVNISDDVLNWNVEKTLFEDHEVLPVGYISSNSASVSFDNTFNQFSYENSSAKYYGMLDKRIGVKIYSVIDNTDIPQFTGFVDSWDIKPDNDATIDCYDMAKVLQQTQGSDMLLGPDVPIGRFIRILFDSIGLNELSINTGSDIINSVSVPEKTSVKLFWMSKNDTFWDSLQEFCISHQCVVYFDEYGKPVFKTRKKALATANTSDQVFTYEDTDQELSNIVSISQSAKPRIGNLIVKYSPRGFDTQNDIESAYQATTAIKQKAPIYKSTTFYDTLWQPDEGWILGAAPIVKTIGLTDTEITIESPEIVKFVDKDSGRTEFIMNSGLTSFSGYFFINGEIIYYGATRFWAVYNDGTPAGNIDIANKEEYMSKVMSNPNLNYLMHTGKLVNLKRGQFNTPVKQHLTDISSSGSWSIEQFKIGEQTSTAIGSPTFSIKNRTIKLATGNKTTGKQTLAEIKKAEERRKHIQIARVQLSANNYRRFETNVRFTRPAGADLKSGEIDSIGGIVFDYNPDTNAGYYVEIGLEETTSSFKTLNNNEQSVIENKSILIYKINAAGERDIIGYADAPKGVAKKYINSTSIYPDSISFSSQTNYDIQIARTKRTGSNWINLYVMGQLILQAEDKSPLPLTNNAGVFVRGDSTAEFNKFAAWDTDGTDSLDQDGGFIADSSLGFMTQVIVNGSMSAPSKNTVQKKYDFFEFYPMMREIRVVEFDYTKYPATPVKIAAGAASSSYGAAILDQTSFRAKIAVINESNFPVELYSVFPGSPVAPYPKLIGNVIKKYDSREYKTTISKAKADDAKFEIDSEWIQTEQEAKDIAEFIRKQSSVVKSGKTNDAVILDLDVFTNPLIQLGDTVDVIYAPLGLNSASHSFIISGISQSFDNGISTRVRLQEVAIG